MQTSLFDTLDISYDDLVLGIFQAYYVCRANKRNTISALAYEIDYESKCIALATEIYNGTYSISPSIAFIVEHPVKREIFAADFRDRIVHHYIVGILEPLFEKLFIHDSYACRKWKWVLYGRRRVEWYIRSATQNYTRPAYSLQLDIQGFFMSISRDILYREVCTYIDTQDIPEKNILYILLKLVIYNDPTKECIVCGSRKKWIWLPHNKSLFHSAPLHGMAIWNVTSQVLANFYLHILDIYIQRDLHIRYYARYVDDFILIHHDRVYLHSLIVRIQDFLYTTRSAVLHPHKVVLKSVYTGILFLGGYILPYRTYVSARLQRHIHTYLGRLAYTYLSHGYLLSSFVSYLGHLSHFSAYRYRRYIVQRFLQYIQSYYSPHNIRIYNSNTSIHIL